MTSTRHVEGESTLDERLSHLTANERAGLAAFVNRLRQHYGNDLLRVVLFGSKARGDFDDESDLDVLVVVRIADGGYRKYWNEIVNIAWDIEFAYNLVITLVIKDEAGYTSMCKNRLLLARNIEKDGIELWTTQPRESTLESA
jgi:predicted nucleotidyltransferase